MSLLFGDFAFDQERRQLLRGGRPVRLEPKAYELLGLLLERRPQALSKAQIRNVLWPRTFVSESALARLVTELRAALADDVRQPRFIRTLHGFGYAFSGDAGPAPGGPEVEAPEAEAVARSPYPGLASFTEEDASRFFGRESEVEALLGKIRRHKLLAVIGPSGVGKTSFVRAGLVASRPPSWAAIVLTPAERPFAALAQALSREVAGDADALGDLIRGVADPVQDLRAVLSAVSRWRRKHVEALLVVDQFEELFTQNPLEIQTRFASLLAAIAAEADVHVVLSLRDDFLFRCSEHQSLLPVFEALTPLRPPSKDGVTRAIREPAAKEGFAFEDDTLVGEMVDAVFAERGALPLLAFAVSRLWEKRDRARNILTRAAHDEIGGVQGALAQHAEATLETIGPAREALVREIFRNLTTAQGTRAVLAREELLSAFPDRAAAEEVLRQLIGARLLTSYETESSDGIQARHAVEVIHESLLTAWPRLVRWQTQDADGALLRDQLRQTARLWDERGRTEDLLWTGASYLEYRAWHARYPGGLSSLQEDFAQAMARLDNRRRRRRGIAVGVAIGLLATGLATVGLFWRRSEASRRVAAAQALRAEAAKLLALAQLQLDEYPTAALAYATRSLELSDTEEARRFALEALWRGPTDFVVPLPPAQFRTLAFSPNGRWLALGSFDADVLVWPSSGGAPLILKGHERAGSYREVAFGPKSDLLMTKTDRGDPLRIWSIPQGQLLRKTEFGEFTAFRLRGGRLLSWTTTPGREWLFKSRPVLDGPPDDLGRIRMTNVSDWDTDATGKWLALARGHDVVVRPLDRLRDGEERLVGTHPANVKWIVFGPDRQLLSRDEKGEIRLWSLDSREARPQRSLQAPADIQAGWLDRTGSRVLAALNKERLIRVWDLAAPADSQPLMLRRGDAVRIDQLDTTPDGQWLAAANESSASLWPLVTRYPRVLTGHTDRVFQLGFAPDGSWVASGSWDGSLRIWPLGGRVGIGGAPGLSRVRKLERSHQLSPPGPNMVYGLAVDPSGRRLLITKAGGKLFLAQPLPDASPVPLEPGVMAPSVPAFARDGRRAAVGMVYAPTPNGLVIRIWDVATGKVWKDLDPMQGKRSTVAQGYAGGVQTLEFAPDGRLYSAGSGGVRRWDVDRGTYETLVTGAWMTMDLSDDGRSLLTVTRPQDRPDPPDGSVVFFHDLTTRDSRRLVSHGSDVIALALDPAAAIAVTGSSDGIVRAGPVTGEEPYLFYGHKGAVWSIAVSPDGRWIASGGQDGTVRLWPMPDFSKPPLHTLPYQELLSKLKTLTNLRVVEDKGFPTGYRLDVGPSPGWETAPTW